MKDCESIESLIKTRDYQVYLILKGVGYARVSSTCHLVNQFGPIAAL